MYRGLRVIGIAPVFDEEVKIREVLRRVPADVVDEMLVVDDGSTDGSAQVAREMGATVLQMGQTRGVGAALRAGYDHALSGGFDVAVVMAGNNKDAPEEIPRLLGPIAAGKADFVQGSRYLDKRASFGDMSWLRRLATRVHPILFSLLTGRRVTESTNGFRAVHRRVLEDPQIDLHQDWLDAYELEPYLYFSAIRRGHRTTEVPVTKIYPSRSLGQTKMRPFIGWWSILRPLFLLALGLRR